MQEAEIALAGGADILDLKDPSRGALGALPIEIITACVAGIARQRIVSATAGDLAMEPELVCNAVQRLSACGVDIVKIGLFPGGDVSACISALRGETARGTRLVAVMFADQGPDFSLIGRCACRLRRRDARHGRQIRGCGAISTATSSPILSSPRRPPA
jgi:dihydroneopterin aldolase